MTALRAIAPSSRAPGTILLFVIGCYLTPEFQRVVEPGGELQTKIIGTEIVECIAPLAPLEFAAHHDVGGRVIQQVDQSILSALERVGRLTIGIVDVEARVPD